MQSDDLEAFWAMRNTEAVARYQGWSLPFPKDEARAFISEMTLAHPDTPQSWFQFALVTRQTGVFVGDIGVHTLMNDEVEIGFSLHPDHQKKGLMTEALQAMFGYLFDQRGKLRISGTVETRNKPS